jgi:hypothetical protein
MSCVAYHGVTNGSAARVAEVPPASYDIPRGAEVARAEGGAIAGVTWFPWAAQGHPGDGDAALDRDRSGLEVRRDNGGTVTGRGRSVGCETMLDRTRTAASVAVRTDAGAR